MKQKIARYFGLQNKPSSGAIYGLYSGPTALFAAIFPYCHRWLQAICIFTTDVLPEMGRLSRLVVEFGDLPSPPPNPHHIPR